MEQQAHLAGRYGVTDRCVRLALSRDSDNELARSIRKAALRMGCVDMVYAPASEVYVQVDGDLIQETEAGDIRRISLRKCKVVDTPAKCAEVEEADIIE